MTAKQPFKKITIIIEDLEEPKDTRIVEFPYCQSPSFETIYNEMDVLNMPPELLGRPWIDRMKFSFRPHKDEETGLYYTVRKDETKPFIQFEDMMQGEFSYSGATAMQVFAASSLKDMEDLELRNEILLAIKAGIERTESDLY